MHVYDDDFPSCEETRATLLVYSDDDSYQERVDLASAFLESGGR